MNVERIRELAAHVRGLEHVLLEPGWSAGADPLRPGEPLDRFSMTIWAEHTRCGTAGCLGGHTLALWPDRRLGIPRMVRAAEQLGLGRDVAEDLFYPPLRVCDPIRMYSEIRPDQAADVLDMVLAGVRPKDAWLQVVGPSPDSGPDAPSED